MREFFAGHLDQKRQDQTNKNRINKIIRKNRIKHNPE